jgi:predicted DNA-binding transcriptional regulator AlpA
MGVGEKSDNSNGDRDYLDRLIREQDAADFLGMSVRTVQGWRLKGGGPHYIRAGNKAIRYRRRDLMAWTDQNIRINASDMGVMVQTGTGRSFG